MDRRVLGTLIVAVALGLWLAWSPDSTPPPPEAARPSASRAPGTDAPSASTPTTPRTQLPRPSTRRRPPPRPIAPSPAPVLPADELAAPPEELAPPIPAEELAGAVKAVVRDEVTAEIVACLEATEAPALDGRMLLQLHLGADGLDEATVEGAELPRQLTDCVADAVWNASWPRLDEGEVAVTYPVVVSSE